jgi:acetoin utilization protein AcuB
MFWSVLDRLGSPRLGGEISPIIRNTSLALPTAGGIIGERRTTMLVRNVMTRDPITVRPDSDPLAALALCKSGEFGRLPVVDEDGRLLGIVTEHDLRLFLSTAPSPGVMKRQHRVRQIMHSPVITVPPECPLEEAARLMIRYDVGGLPVVDDRRRTVGIITRSDIFAQFAEALGAGTYSIRVTVQVPDLPGELAKLAQRIAEVSGNICSVISHRPEQAGSLNLTLRVEGVQRNVLMEAIRADPEVRVFNLWKRNTEEEE